MNTLPDYPRTPGTGFLYLPPFRVQGYSVAGEETWVQIPELDVCFDVGRAPSMMLTSPFVALSHGHMDHSAGVGYYFSQRVFQGMSPGTLLCPEALAEPVRKLMAAWVSVEHQRAPYKVIGMVEGQELEIKPHVFLRAFNTDHRVPSIGFSVVEKRGKLREELLGLPQEKLIQLKKAGQEITYIKEVPLAAYVGDTQAGDFLLRPDVAGAQVLICECTFLDDGHDDKAEAGRHMHLRDIARLLAVSTAPNVVLTHLSRRTNITQARQQIDKVLPADQLHRVHVLMDHRANRARYERQLAESHASAT